MSKVKPLPVGGLDHAEVDLRALVAGEADVADLAGLLRLLEDIDDVAGTEGLLRIARADDFVDLHEVDVVGLQAMKRIVELLLGGGGGAAVDLGHEEGLLPIAVLAARGPCGARFRHRCSPSSCRGS